MSNLEIFRTFAPKVENLRTGGINAVIYTRVSDISQEENTSLESQLKYCKQFADRKGFNVVATFGGTYESAKSDSDRDQFQKMMTYVKRSKSISYILVYSYERFSRTGMGGAQIADNLLKEYGIVTLACTQELDPRTAAGSFQQRILFLVGQMDNEMRRDKTATGMRELLQKGYFPFAAPIGYTNLSKGRAVDHQLVINEKGKLLRKAFEWKGLEQMPNATIARKLNSLGFKTDERRIAYMLANPFYCGVIVSRLIPGEAILAKHPPLVSKDLFLKANNIIAESRNHPVSHNEDDNNLPLKRFMKCGHCDTPMTGYLVRKKSLYYYKCRVKGCATNKSAKSLHEQFKGLLSAFTLDSDYLNMAGKYLKEIFHTVFSDQFENQHLLKAKITETQQKLETIQERYAIGEINRDLYTKFTEKYTKESEDLKKEISKMSLTSSNLEKGVNLILKMCMNPLKTWECATIDQRMRLQNQFFPDGIIYDRENGVVRTKRINAALVPIPALAKLLAKIKKGEPVDNDQFSHLVTSSGFKPETSTAVM